MAQHLGQGIGSGQCVAKGWDRMKTAKQGVLRFLWWNVQDFAHYDKRRAGEARWPRSPDEYQGKMAQVEEAFRAILRETGHLHLVALAEVTNQAATELRDRLFPRHEVLSMDLRPGQREFQVTILYDKAWNFREKLPFVGANVPPGTRPMVVLELKYEANRVRFVACHWASRFDGNADEEQAVRQDLATQLAHYAHDYLEDVEGSEARHLMILGDLNHEPYGLPLSHLHGARERRRAQKPAHQADREVKRSYLYNCSWRALGEVRPHDGSVARGESDAAGTYYWRQEKTWHTFDQVLVSGSLLTGRVPFLDEARLRVMVGPKLLDADGWPRKFEWLEGKPRGVSDHLPVAGVIVLQR